jgi:hypothetical protein
MGSKMGERMRVQGLGSRMATRLVGATAVVLLAIGGGALGAAGPASADEAVPTPAPSATAPSAPAPSAPAPSAPALEPAAAPPKVVIPVELVHSVKGGYLPLVEVSLNGSAPIKMMVDTGTNILVTFPGSIVGANPPVTSTGLPKTVDYNGTSTTGTIATATVSIGGATSPSPVPFVDGASCTPSCLGEAQGARGVIGISQLGSKNNDHHDPQYELYSALAQMGPELSAGYTVDFTGSDATIELGAPAAPKDDDVVVQRPVNDGEVYPNGQKAYLSPTLCWTVSVDQRVVSECHETVLDTGQSTGVLRGDQWKPFVNPVSAPPLPGSGIQVVGWLKTGAVVEFATSATSEPFSGLVEPGVEPYKYGLYQGGDVTSGILNIGNGFYLKHPVGFDNDSGLVTIGAAQGTPSAPLAVSARAGDASASAEWSAPEYPGGGAVTGFVVTVTHPDGRVVSTTSVGADRVSARVGGLENGKEYRLAVAAANEFGTGPSVKAEGLISPLADALPAEPSGGGAALAATGAPTPLPVVGIAGLLLLAGAAALVRRRRIG